MAAVADSTEKRPMVDKMLFDDKHNLDTQKSCLYTILD
jgi:hypothetical protein